MRDAYAPRLADDTMACVLAGGRGSRLMELTDNCAKPAIHFGGKSRIIDFAISNAINSGIRRIGVATQYKQSSLIRHVQRVSQIMQGERGKCFDILPASRYSGNDEGYRGTADAVFQNLDVIEGHAPAYVVVLAGDHIYKMDYELMLRQHVNSGADVTVGCIAVPREEARGFGVMNVDEKDNITAFVEKPKEPQGIPGDPDLSLASMGIYAFSTRFLFDQLRRDAAASASGRDFGGDIIPHIVRHGKAVAHRFSASCIRTHGERDSYWRDVGTLDAYFESNLDLAANLDLTESVPPFNMQDSDWPIWTDGLHAAPPRDAPGGRDGMPSSRTSGHGAVAEAAIGRSMLFNNVQVGTGACIEDAVILPDCNVGPGARLSRVIVDSGVSIPAGLVVGEDPESDAAHFRRTEKGVCLITRKMIDQLS